MHKINIDQLIWEGQSQEFITPRSDVFSMFEMKLSQIWVRTSFSLDSLFKNFSYHITIPDSSQIRKLVTNASLMFNTGDLLICQI